jgi:hypothetical protein
MTLWEGEDVVTVPESALFRSGEGWAVFLAEEGRAAPAGGGRRARRGGLYRAAGGVR